jgi:hypothetical protein
MKKTNREKRKCKTKKEKTQNKNLKKERKA